VRQADGSFLADARASLEDVTATVGAEFDVGDAADDVDTLGGYLVTRVGRVPVRGGTEIVVTRPPRARADVRPEPARTPVTSGDASYDPATRQGTCRLP